jgi:PKD repeat protein
VQEGETVHLSGDDSYDEDGHITQYSWDFGDGTKESSNKSIINYIWKQFGSYKITLTVTDNDGAIGTTTINILVIKSINNDTDYDGLPDTWEIMYGLDPYNPDDANLDSDGDSLTNLDEYILGTDPIKFDTDGDGVVDNKDAFPLDAAASLDSDGDKYPDSWNPGKSEKDSTTGLKLDAYPNDPNKYEKQTPKDETSQDYTYAIVLVVIMILILLIIATTKLFILRLKHHREKNLDSDDEMLNNVKNKFLQGEPLKELEYSQNDIEDRLERSFKTGQISENTYNSIRSEILYSDEVEFTQPNYSIAKGKE